LPDGIDHRPEIFERGIELQICGWDQSTAASLSDGLQAGQHFGLDLFGRAKGQGLLDIERAPETQILAEFIL